MFTFSNDKTLMWSYSDQQLLVQMLDPKARVLPTTPQCPTSQSQDQHFIVKFQSFNVSKSKWNECKMFLNQIFQVSMFQSQSQCQIKVVKYEILVKAS